MTPEQSRHEEASRWLAQARKDLNAASLLIPGEPSRSVFHSQQDAEKAAKGFLSFHDVAFRKTHDLVELGRQCVQLAPDLEALFKEATDLIDYAVVFRYLDAPREPDVHEARSAFEIAERVLTAVSTLLT